MVTVPFAEEVLSSNAHEDISQLHHPEVPEPAQKHRGRTEQLQGSIHPKIAPAYNQMQSHTEAFRFPQTPAIKELQAVYKTGRFLVHLETNLPFCHVHLLHFLLPVRAILSEPHGGFTQMSVCTGFLWSLNARSFAFIQRGESLHYPCRLFEQCYLGLVPVYVFLTNAACIPEQSLNPTISCRHKAPFIMHVQIKRLKRLRNANRPRIKTKGTALFFWAQVRDTKTLQFFDSYFGKRGTPNIWRKWGLKSTERLINHTHAITIPTYLLSLVITATETKLPVTTTNHTDWFNSSHCLIYST